MYRVDKWQQSKQDSVTHTDDGIEICITAWNKWRALWGKFKKLK